MPAVYGNGARIIQTPDSVVISYEMVHDTRVIPLDGRPPLGDGHPSADGRLARPLGRRHARRRIAELHRQDARSAARGTATGLRMTERFTRVDPEMIDYEIRVDDPTTFTRRGRCG